MAIIAVDLDGVIFEKYWKEDIYRYKPNKFGKLLFGAKLALTSLQLKHEIIIHSARLDTSLVNKGYTIPKMKTMIINELSRVGIPWDMIWDKPGKPQAHVYIDDNSIRFSSLAKKMPWPIFDYLDFLVLLLD